MFIEQYFFGNSHGLEPRDCFLIYIYSTRDVDYVEVEVNDGCIKQTDRIGHHTISGNISLFQIHQKLKKVVQRLQPANFETKPSVVAVLPEQQPTFWGVLY